MSGAEGEIEADDAFDLLRDFSYADDVDDADIQNYTRYDDTADAPGDGSAHAPDDDSFHRIAEQVARRTPSPVAYISNPDASSAGATVPSAIPPPPPAPGVFARQLAATEPPASASRDQPDLAGPPSASDPSGAAAPPAPRKQVHVGRRERKERWVESQQGWSDLQPVESASKLQEAQKVEVLFKDYRAKALLPGGKDGSIENALKLLEPSESAVSLHASIAVLVAHLTDNQFVPQFVYSHALAKMLDPGYPEFLQLDRKDPEYTKKMRQSLKKTLYMSAKELVKGTNYRNYSILQFEEGSTCTMYKLEKKKPTRPTEVRRLMQSRCKDLLVRMSPEFFRAAQPYLHKSVIQELARRPQWGEIFRLIRKKCKSKSTAGALCHEHSANTMRESLMALVGNRPEVSPGAGAFRRISPDTSSAVRKEVQV